MANKLSRIDRVARMLRRNWADPEPGFEIETFGDLREQNETFGWGLSDRELNEAWRRADTCPL